MTNENTFWLSFDLGFKGDYENLYQWLDSVGASDRGQGLALISNYKRKNTSISLQEEIKSILQEKMTIKPSDRIYLIHSEEDKTKGIFLFGRSKRGLWEGYSSINSTKEDVA